MLLDGDCGQSFELALVGYETYEEIEALYGPGESDPEATWEGSWLVVRATWRGPEDTFQKEGAYLMAVEVVFLSQWLTNAARGVFQTPVIDFQEPELRFEQCDVSTESVSLRVGCMVGYDGGPTIEMAVPRAQLLEAAASLRTALSELVGEEDVSRAIASPSKPHADTFFVEWAAVLPAATDADVAVTVDTLAGEMKSTATILHGGELTGAPGMRYVVFRTSLRTPEDRPREALFNLLWHFPGIGRPHIGYPFVWPNGGMSVSGSVAHGEGIAGLDIGREVERSPYVGMRAWFTLTNIEGGEIFSGIHQIGPYLPSIPRDKGSGSPE